MKFTNLFSVVAVIYSCVCCVRASGTLEIGFISSSDNKIKYVASYCDDTSSSSKSSYSADGLATSINSVSNGVLSVDKTRMEYFNSDMESYSVGSNDGGFRSLVVLDGVKCDCGSGKFVIKNDNKKNPVSIQFNGNNTNAVRLPNIDFKDVPLVKLKDIDRVGDVTTNATMGVFYNKSMQINGGTFNNASANLDRLCLIANKGTNNFKNPNGTKYHFGGKYSGLPFLNEMAKNGLTIDNIEVSKCEPTEHHIKVNYNDKTSLDKLISMTKPGLFVIDGLRPHCSTDRVNWSPIVKEIWKSMYSRDAEIKYILDNFRSSDYRTQFLTLRVSYL